MMKMISGLKRSFWAALVVLPCVAASISLVESSCVMRVTFPMAGQDVSLEMAYNLETETSVFFESLLEEYNFGNDMHIKPLQVRVDAADRLITSTKAVVTAAVSLLYETDTVESFPELHTILNTVVVQSGATPRNPFTFGTPEFVFQFLNDANSVVDHRNSGGRSSSEIGLIVAVSFLSVILCVVSSVLLYITGGFTVCGNGLLNCLFEEVEEDPFPVQHKHTFQSGSEDDDDEEGDEESHMTSVPPSSASGILGVHRNLNAPISLDEDDDESSMMYGDSATPTSSDGLGISSVRKLHNNNRVLGRFRQTPFKKR